ncbi:uncharacterized protein LOC127038762 isoform X3 [Gopherus flavomarginatus]|uniref:uncharacterized protein LOC127038762 isoform X3 n=1 Tax=Gopherus flavomarginatus TaxID=286002 RepID=UPI0021CC0574|nr:uncharacterized protein LOC127038762 isoform X3 [Gopherus flavomarginatus]
MEPLDNRDPLFPPPNETADLPLPNLTPRHQELIPTPCGPIKPWSELSSPVKIYFCVTILSLLSVIGLTTETLFQQTHEDFTISLIQLIGVVFCVYYVTRGILQENRQELIVFILSILLVMFRSIVNFTVVSAEQKPNVLARFILILLVGSFDVICAIILIQSQSMMAFRVGGALESLQSQYFMLNLCFSMLTFDLQAQILKELKPLVWIFLSQNIPEVANLVYLLYMVIRHWGQELSYALEAAVIIGSCISVAIKSVLFWALLHIYHSFGQGLRERMFSSYGRIDS